VSLRVSSGCLVLISFVTSTANSKQSSCDESRSLSSNCFTSAKRKQLHSFVTTLNTHLPAKLCSSLVSVRPHLNLISNHRRRSGPRGSVPQCVFLLFCLILSCSAATSTLTGMGTCWQSDKNANTYPTTSHQHDIGVAPIDALHAISNENSKAGTHPSQSTGEVCEGSFTRNSGIPLDSTQARESLTVLLLLALFFRSLLASLLPKSPIRSASLLTPYFAVPVPPIARVYSVYLCLLSYPRIPVASHPRSLLAATASLHQSCKSVSLAPLPYDLTPLPRFNYSTRSSLPYTDQPHLSSCP
jgi:hypothetical protein